MQKRTRKCEKCEDFISLSNFTKHTKVCDGSGKTNVPKLTHCPHCGMSLLNLNTSQRANHVRWCEENPKRNEYVQSFNKRRKTHVPTPEQRQQTSDKIKQRHAEGKYDNAYKSRIGKPGIKHTEEAKQKLSEIRKQWLKDNPDKHPWKRTSKFTSPPCEKIKTELETRGYVFVSEFQPLKERFFSLDIAFPQSKIGIEINGNQHYNSGEFLKPYYKNRHDLIENEGWVLFEIPYYEAYNPESVDTILYLLDNLLNSP